MAEIFFAVYEIAVDTILLAFLEDCEVHGGEPKWAPPLLMEAVGQGSDSPEPSKHPSNAVAPGGTMMS